MTTAKKPRRSSATRGFGRGLDFNVQLRGEVLEAFLRFENDIGLTRAETLRLVLREYLTLTGHLRADSTPG